MTIESELHELTKDLDATTTPQVKPKTQIDELKEVLSQEEAKKAFISKKP